MSEHPLLRPARHRPLDPLAPAQSGTVTWS